MGDGMSSISGLSNSASYQAPQQFRQQFAPTQGSTIQPQFNSFNQNNNDFQPRGKGQRTPRAQKQCYNCGQQGHTKRYCPCLTPYLQAWYAANPPKSSNQNQQSGQSQVNSNQINNQGNPTAGYPTQGNPTAGYPTQGYPTSVSSQNNYDQQQRPPRRSEQNSSTPHSPLLDIQEHPLRASNSSSSLIDSESTSVMQYHARGVSQQRFTPNTYIEIQLGHSTQRCLLDSGCDYSMIPRRLIPKVPLEPESMDVFAANGSPIKILGSTCLNFKIEGENVTANVMVSEQVEEFMLGYDWLSSQQIIWNFNAKQILFRDKPVRLKPRTSSINISRVYTKERIEVAPATEQNIPVRLVHKNWRAPYADWLIQPKKISEGVLLARTILPDNDEYAAVRVINLTDSHVTIPLDCELGSAYMAQAIPYTNRIRAGSVTTNRPDSKLVPDNKVPDKPTLPRIRSEAYNQKLPDYLLPVVKTLPDSLSPAQFETALESLHRNADVFSKDEGDLGLTDLITHHINTGTARPVHEGLRRHTQTHLKIIDDSVEKMLEYGIVEPASSPWASNVVVVTKQDSTPGITLD